MKEESDEVEKKNNREVKVEAEKPKKVLANFTITKKVVDLETDKENNQIPKQKKSEKVLMEEKLKQVLLSSVLIFKNTRGPFSNIDFS